MPRASSIATSSRTTCCGAPIDELRAATAAGPANVKADLRPAIRSVLERGLDPDPAKRWPDMERLLAALERARKRRKRIALAAAACVAICGVAVGAHAMQ